MNRLCKYCGKELLENCKGSVCKSCKDNRKNQAEKIGAAIGVTALTIGTVVLKLILKK